MEASTKGIDVGGRVLDALLAFAGDNEEQSRIFFKVKGKKVLAAATAKDRSLEIEGEAGEEAEQGEWPVEAGFLRNVSAMTVNGSKKVPAIVARLLCERTGVSTADLVLKSSGEAVDTVKHHKEMPQNRQLSFGAIKKTIDIDVEKKGGWFPMHRDFFAPLTAVSMAAKKCPISFFPNSDELGPIYFEAKGDGLKFRGILKPPAVEGPGEQAVDAEDDDDSDEGDERQPGLFESKEGKAGEDESDDGGIISDAEAKRLTAEAKKANGRKPRARTKNRREATT